MLRLPLARNPRRCVATSVVLLIVAATALLFASPDAFTHDLYNRVDSAWYFLCGKAWACGMTPYVDFADSKGPLLWLIYGAAYLISAHDYSGVYLLNVPALWFSLLIAYRTARLFTSPRRALMCALLMVPAFLYPAIHEEVKTEDWAQPFVMLALYGATRLHYGATGSIRTATVQRLLAGIGISLGATLMIKYSFTAMLGIFALYALADAPRHGVGRVKAVKWLIIGAAVVLVPIAVLLAWQGAFTAMINEYFINTLYTLPRLRQTNGGLVEMLLRLLRTVPSALFPPLCFASAGAAWRLLPGRKTFPVVVTVWFFLLTIPNARWLYYYVICAFTLLFGIVALVRRLPSVHRISAPAVLVAVGAAVTVFTGGAAVAYAPANFFTVRHPARLTYMRYARLLSHYRQPTVVYWRTHSVGLETPANGLPACRYFAMQNGATPLMLVQTDLIVARRSPDFVVVATVDTLLCAQLRLLGYQEHNYGLSAEMIASLPVGADVCDDQLVTVFSRDSLADIPVLRQPVATDVLLRRHLP